MIRFILVFGVLIWGILTGGLFAFIFPLISGESHDLKSVLLPMILFPFGGILWGWLMWKVSESSYDRHIADAKSGCEKHSPA